MYAIRQVRVERKKPLKNVLDGRVPAQPGNYKRLSVYRLKGSLRNEEERKEKGRKRNERNTK